MKFTDNEKYAIITILTSIMEADTIIHPKEVEFMDKMIKKLNISITDLDHMEVIDLAWCKATILTMPLEKQQVVKTWFQTMVYVDGNIDPRETEVINQIFSSRQINI